MPEACMALVRGAMLNRAPMSRIAEAMHRLDQNR